MEKSKFLEPSMIGLDEIVTLHYGLSNLIIGGIITLQSELKTSNMQKLVIFVLASSS
jgi:hypothetical protein